MKNDFNVLVFISGRGSNFKALIDNANSYKVMGVLSDREDVLGLKYAKDAKIAEYVLPRRNYLTLADQKAAILEKTLELAPDLICLAGFMLIIGPEFIEKFEGRIINIHPSLLPKHPGLHTHSQVLEEGETVHGCTVHVVDSGVDTGPIIAQASCAVHPGDNEDSLAQRVLSYEHTIYSWVVNNIASGDIILEANAEIRYSAKVLEEAKINKFILSYPK